MITYETRHLVDKFLSDMEYQTKNPSAEQAKLASTGFCTGLKGFDWQIGGLRRGDVFLLIGSQEQINTTFLAFILHSLCWKQQIPVQVYSCANPVDRWLPYLLSAELKMSYSTLRWGAVTEEKARVKQASQYVKNLPLWLSDLELNLARWSDFELSKGQILLIDGFLFERGGKGEEFLRNLKRIALQKQKIILISTKLDEEMCHYPDVYTNLRLFGLLSSMCDFVGLLSLCVPGSNTIVDATSDTGEMKIIEQDFSPMELVSLRMLYNSRLPRSYANFLYKFDAVDFRDTIN